jgi:hypothetical protein
VNVPECYVICTLPDLLTFIGSTWAYCNGVCVCYPVEWLSPGILAGVGSSLSCYQPSCSCQAVACPLCRRSFAILPPFSGFPFTSAALWVLCHHRVVMPACMLFVVLKVNWSRALTRSQTLIGGCSASIYFLIPFTLKLECSLQCVCCKVINLIMLSSGRNSAYVIIFGVSDCKTETAGICQVAQNAG